MRKREKRNMYIETGDNKEKFKQFFANGCLCG